MESTIILHWGIYDKSVIEKYPTVNFDSMFEVSWLESDFAKYCIEMIDKSQYQGGHLIVSPVLGLIPPTMLSGAIKTLLIAYNRKDLYMPLSNIGDNCSEALFRSGIGTPSRWTWMGYMSHLIPEQRILIESTGEIILGKDWLDRSLHNTPDITTLVPGIKHACDYEDGGIV